MSQERMELTNGRGHLEKDDLCQSLESIIAVEDPYNGEMVVRNICKDFIAERESETDMWQI